MGIIEDLADKLAEDTLNAADRFGDEKLVDAISAALGASSPTVQEAFMTSVRVRTAERRARRLLEQRVAAALKAAPAAPGQGAAPPSSGGPAQG
ncbi:MAG: hypothetical protein ACLFQL_03465 [Paracoccaceae bacterium]